MQTCPRCKQQPVSTQPVEMEDAGGVGMAWVCETCHAALTGRFFSDQPLRETTACPFGHPVTPENSPRVGWVTCPTCLETTALPYYRAAARRAAPGGLSSYVCHCRRPAQEHKERYDAWNRTIYHERRANGRAAATAAPSDLHAQAGLTGDEEIYAGCADCGTAGAVIHACIKDR